MKYFFTFILGIGIASIYFLYPRQKTSEILSPITQIITRPLDKYTIDNLTIRGGIASEIILDEAVATTSSYTAYLFHYVSDGNRVTGLAHQPNGNGPFLVIVQLRGYVDRQIYQPGMGTKHSAEVFAKNGFISYAPDFLGYGGSDNPSDNIFEERFQTYTAVLDLLASIKSEHIGIWAHSNGGQIALTVLEILQKPIPTTLWAPVTKPFPYSILYYTDEADDRGKLLRKKLAELESVYDVDQFTMTNYLDRLKGQLQIHQGLSDEAVPYGWTNDFVDTLKKLDKDVRYVTYPNTDHHMNGSWNTVIERDIEFFKEMDK